MNVELLQYPEHPERAVATAARLCYAPVGATELMETMPPERVQSVLSTIMLFPVDDSKIVVILLPGRNKLTSVIS